VVASCHWGLGQEVLEYMTQIAHAAIDAGAHMVMGHGPHYSLPVEIYKGRPIFYGLGSFSFHTGHGGRQHGDWLGMMVRTEIARDGLARTRFQFVRHNDRNETVLCTVANEKAALENLTRRSAQRGAKLIATADEVLVEPAV
jgi:poly-gamma-glutamate capsule biosynthesis protein CapA/YwtB (metallophosphatase superfamily)